MNPIYEHIEVARNTSLKVATYTHEKNCPTSNWHIHPEYELVYVRNGCGTLQIDSKVLPYTHRALLFLGPNIPHADFGNKDLKDNFEVVIQFTERFVNERMLVFPEFRKLRKLIQMARGGMVFHTSIKDELQEAFESMAYSGETKKLIHFFAILEHLSETERFESILSKENTTIHKTADVDRLELIFQFVNAHYGEHISTKKLAGHIGFTQNSFCRFFKKMTKKTFVQFLNEFRIGKAVELFNERRWPVSEVMYQCGFSDPSYFTKQFKKYQGKTPSAYMLH